MLPNSNSIESARSRFKTMTNDFINKTIHLKGRLVCTWLFQSLSWGLCREHVCWCKDLCSKSQDRNQSGEWCSTPWSPSTREENSPASHLGRRGRGREPTRSCPTTESRSSGSSSGWTFVRTVRTSLPDSVPTVREPCNRSNRNDRGNESGRNRNEFLCRFDLLLSLQTT